MKLVASFGFLITFFCSLSTATKLTVPTEINKNFIDANVEVLKAPIFKSFSFSLNIISTENYQVSVFKNKLLAELFPSSTFAVKQEIVGVENTFSRRRRCVLMIISSFNDFLKIRATLTRERFKFNGLYVISLVRGVLPEIRQIFKHLWRIQIFNVVVLFESSHETTQLQTFMPFNNRSCNDVTPVNLIKYKNGKFEKEFFDLFPSKTRNMHGCQVNVALANSTPPFVLTTFSPNGTLEISGGDIKLLDVLSKSLNFKINYVFVGNEGFFYPNGTSEGPMKYLMEEKADLSIANWWMKIIRLYHLDSTMPYLNDRLVFAISPGKELTTFEKLAYPFRLTVWVFIFICLALGFLVIFVIKRRSISEQNFVFGVGVKNPYLNMFIGLYGGSQKILPKTNFARFLLMLFLLYSLVMRTLYQGSFFRLMQSNKRHSEVESIEEMINDDFRFLIYFGDADQIDQIPVFKERWQDIKILKTFFNFFIISDSKASN